MNAAAFRGGPAALLAAALCVTASGPSFGAPAAGSGLNFSGSADTTLTGLVASGAVAGENDGDFSYGLEEYANLRLRARIGERGTFYGAANFIAAAGSPVAASASEGNSAYVSGENYAATVEPERLYLRVEGDAFDLETGLMRLAFGFGQAWSPTDFLSKRNPLLPDARPRGLLAVAATSYPSDPWKLKAFSAAGSDPEKTDGTGALLGGSADFGIDYSFLKGDLYALAQYLYNGGGLAGGLDLSQTHYLYGSLLYRIDDYTSASLDAAASLEDGSLSPALTLSHEPFQGLALSLSGRVPIGTADGEFGPARTGTRVLVTGKIKAKF